MFFPCASPTEFEEMSRAIPILMSLLIIGFTAGLVYKGSVATQQALNEANEALFNKAVKGSVTKPAAASLKAKLDGFKKVARTLGDMYLKENLPCYNLGSAPSSATAYLRATVGLQQAWIDDIRFIYISYKVPDVLTSVPNLWGDCGCQINDDDETECFYWDTTGTYRYYNGTTLTSNNLIDSGFYNTADDPYVKFVSELSLGDGSADGVWQPPSIWEDPTNLTGSLPHQLITFSVPLQYDISGHCTAAAQVDFSLSYAESLLLENLPSNETEMVLIYSGSADGAFIATTNKSQTVSESEIYKASMTPYASVNAIVNQISTTLGAVSGDAANKYAVDGSFTMDKETADATEFEAVTVDDVWSIYGATKQDYYYEYRLKWTPSLFGAKALYTQVNSAGVIGIAGAILVFSLINMFGACCCYGGSKKRSADEYRYAESLS